MRSMHLRHFGVLFRHSGARRNDAGRVSAGLEDVLSSYANGHIPKFTGIEDDVVESAAMMQANFEELEV